MDYRLLAIGVNIIMFSIAFLILAFIEEIHTVLGVAFTTLILGVILLTIGLTYIEPLEQLFRDSHFITSKIMNKLLEDTGLAIEHITKTCVKPVWAVVISREEIPCNEIVPGIGLYHGKPYIMIPFENKALETPESEITLEYIENTLRHELLERYGIARDLEIKVNGKNNYTLSLYQLQRETEQLLKKPYNIVKIVIGKILSRILGKNIIIYNDEVLPEKYVLNIKISNGDNDEKS